MVITFLFKEVSNYWAGKQVNRVLFTLGIGFLGGYLLFLLKTPLAWLMGAMILTAIAGCLGVKVRLPVWFRRIGLVTFGIILGQRFTEQLVGVMVDSFVLIMIISIFFIGFAIVNGWLLAKWFHMDWTTALFGSAPGGVSEMVIVGSDLGGDGKSIAIMQSIRVFMVVMTVPFIATILSPQNVGMGMPAEHRYHLFGLLLLLVAGFAGVLVGKRLRLPAFYLLGPLLATALLAFFNVTTSDIPSVLQYSGQVFVGASIGMGFNREDIIKLKKVFITGFLINILLVVLSGLMAIIINRISSIDFLTALLSTAPGGIAEMSMTALFMGGNVALVTAFQVCRMLVIVTIFPLIIRAIRKHRKENTDHHLAN